MNDMSQIYCSNCGKLIASSANYCQFCGTAQHGIEAMTQKSMHRQNQHTHPQQTTPQNNHVQKTIEKRRLCPRAMWSFFLSYIGKTSLLLLLFLLGSFFEPLLFGPLLLGYVLVLYITAVIVHQNYYFEVNGSSFRKEHGVIHKTDVTIPFNRIQNVNITRSLSDRILGLARVDIETAGSSAIKKRNIAGGSSTKAEGHLPGITMPQAREIHDLLIERFSQYQNHPGSSSP